ncbi:hypothetical protein ACLB1S_19275 [Escherichia coli]
MSKLMIVLVVLLSLAAAVLFPGEHENASLRASLDRATTSPAGSRRPSPC